MLHICYAFTDSSGSYHRYVLVALTSVFANTDSAVCAHIVCDETVPEENRALFYRLAERYGQSVAFHAVPAIPREALANVRELMGKGTLFRLFLPELIAEDRLLYLDCDTICNLDVQELFALAGEDAVIAGVPDTGIRDDAASARRVRRLGMDPNRYVNAGVLLLHLGEIRKRCPDFTRATLDGVATTRLRYMDQDVLNALFQERGLPVFLLPDRFNFVLSVGDRGYLPGSDYAGKMLHYTREKPWSALYPAAFSFWRYWGLCFSPQEAFAAMGGLPWYTHHGHLHRFLLREPRVRRMLSRLCDIREQGLAETLLDRLFPARRKRKTRR